ncbi:uncharacterized protein LOC6032089 isoform X5 [Culex quinquefasciatus]|uniref:uncharacterized protein LOC6032089 isoform X5 n=1 Tax=Culex quinquefasciatus TaxID=7176 RepID=UPI0018E3EB4B|nr:uncharacterized protein LOC6032089 isoform X5 [Culex quinquefasciatus]
MFNCLWQLWDWIDPPTFTTMESKKLQQLQQANSHLAPIPQTKPPTFQQQNAADYRPSRASPVFQNHPQYQSFASNFAQINYPHQIRPPQQVAQQQQQQHLSAHSSPKSNSNSLYLSEYSSSSQQQQQQQQPSQQQHHHNTIGSHYHFDQIYQTSSPSSGSGERERLYQTAPRPTQHTHTPSQPGPPQPLTKLELQFQQLQREKIQAQIKTATEALAHQQQTFALRQQLNPPVPNYHLKQNLLQNLSQQHQQQIQHQQQQLQRNAPPSSLNLTSHFQPAQGPMKLTNHANIHDYGATAATNQHAINEAFYQQQQQKHIHAVINKTPNNMQSPAPNQIIIQQNIPGQVVNQACQTQISGVKNNQQQQNQKSPNSDSMSSPSHDGLERRKSGPVHTLKSPVTKRPLNAPVSMSGWLYKQGSDGLKVWRRRWFVLSEYILYYYKSQEEEKLLGTVLLPSYKISACFPEDKVYRKFAFKCEHTNMRTFVFAAETGESMTNWVRALTLATMMQGSSESETSPPSNNARSGDNSDSGIQTYQSQVCKTGASQGPVTPVSDNGGGSQPLYANAPPKPRRANDGGYSSPSPEHIPSERYDQDQQQIYGKTPDSSFMQQSPQIKQQQQQQQHLGYDPNAYPSPGGAGGGQTVYNDAIYGNAKRIERDLYIQKLIQQQQQQQAQLQQLQQQQQVQQQVQQLAMQQTPQRAFTNPFMYPNADRRTPDTYGPPRAALDKHMSDYEDIYNLTMLSKSLPAEDPTPSAATAAAGYRRPMSPLRYDGQNMPMRYTPNYLENNSPAQQQHVQMRARPVQSTIPRPHSADFLEYEARNPIGANSLNGVKGGKLKDGEPARAPRPKSSLDINRTPDNYYYSEASYAEKMRMQSASYLQRAANLGAVAGKEVPGAVNSSTVPRDGYYGGASSSNGRLDYDENVLHQGSASVPRAQRMTMNNLKKYPSQQEQFARSASARLPRKEEDPSARDGERKREESMKRLLEWKQRMLQSPLTRKMSQQQAQQLGLGSPGSTGNPFLSKSGQLQMEAEMYLEQEKQMQAQHQQQQLQQQQQQQQQQQMQHLRVDNKSNLEYNSYSSDDEASISVRNVKNIPKGALTVKPDPSDYRTDPKLVQGYYDPRQTEYYYQDQEGYIRPDISFESTHDLYTQAQLQRAQEINLQQHYQLQDIDRSLAAMNEESPGEKWPPNINQQQVFTPRGPQTPNHHHQQLQQDKSELRTLEMSAGDLLNRTHEELVLLLIQLRRQNSNTARSIEQCCTNIHDIQNSIRMSDGPSRAENLARLEALKKQLCELEKQYEKEKPLINLVDNMVKLGTLYRGAPGKGKSKSSSGSLHASESATLDRLEFNQRIQERRLLQEEQRQWDRLSPNHTELQSKVQQLYQIDQLLQEESGTLQSLQRDKEDLERALGGLKAKIMKGEAPAPAMEAARQQQHTLERELSRVHLMLAENSKKLEKTVADNARLEQELLVLRQKLQASRDTRGSQATLVPGQDGQYVGSATLVLESELRRVQRLVGDMQRQRNELSQAVRQLTDNSDSLHKQINKNGDSRSHIKKRSQGAAWVETDLDSLVSKDQGRHDSTLSLNVSEKQSSVYGRSDLDRSEAFESCSVDSDDLLEDSSGNPFGYPDKQEIKTVRIVKRESERRHRDREKDRSNASTHSLDQVLEEEAQIFEDYNNYHRAKSMPRGVSETHEAFVQNQDVQSYSSNLKDYYSMTANSQNSYPVSMIDRKADLYSGCDRTPIGKTSASKVSTLSLNSSMDGGSVEYSGLRTKTESIQSLTISEQSPVFQSEAAKQILHEMGAPQQGGSNGLSASERQKQKAEHMAQQNKHRRSVPKEKRRHHTAPHHVNAKQIEIMQSENDMNKNNVNWRARDDVDLEVTLRPRSNAPDVVRSAMGPREKISEHTIDKLLAAPSKILIPERYVPEQTPELSPEEKQRRQEKVEAIKKMLSETPMAGNDTSPNQPANAEKRQREHLLQLNQILAQQVMQMSKIVADDKPQDQITENSMAVLPSSICKLRKRGMFNRTSRRNSAGMAASAAAAADDEETRYHSEVEDNDDDDDDDTESPPEPLPLYQQRENYFT